MVSGRWCFLLVCFLCDWLSDACVCVSRFWCPLITLFLFTLIPIGLDFLAALNCSLQIRLLPFVITPTSTPTLTPAGARGATFLRFLCCRAAAFFAAAAAAILRNASVPVTVWERRDDDVLV